MNREIKFRSWDQYTDSIKEVDTIDFGNRKVWLLDGEQRRLNDENEVILLQFTGLKDRTGDEIFEGDILRDEHNDEYGLVEFDEGKFSVLWDNVVEDLFENCENLEIAGNYYENKDLLWWLND